MPTNKIITVLCVGAFLSLQPLTPQATGVTPTVAGRPLTQEEMQQAMVAAGTAALLAKRYDTQTLGTYPRDGEKRPPGASVLSTDALQKMGFDPSANVRQALGGRKGYTYRLHGNSDDPKSVFVELRPSDASTKTRSTWLLLKPKPGVDPNAPLEMTPEEQAAMTQKLAKIAALGGFDATTPGGTTMGRLLGVLETYAIPLEHLEQALTDPMTGAPGDRTAIAADMVRLNEQARLDDFCRDAVNAALPADMNQDGTRLDPQATDYRDRLTANQVRNETFADYAYGAILSELLLNGKITTRDGRRYKTPDEVAYRVDARLHTLNRLRRRLGVDGRAALYYDEDKLLAAMARGHSVRRDDLLRRLVLDAFVELVTPEASLTAPRFTWGNRVEFLADGAAAFRQRLADLAEVAKAARAGAASTYDFTVWKLYDNRPPDPYQLGQTLKQALLAAADAGVDIHVTVDRSVAARDPGAMAILDELDAHKHIRVNKFHNDERGTAGDSNHAKSAIAAGYTKDAKAIVGGRNIHGDYFYTWLDAEFRITGPLAQSLQRDEDDMWNQQARMHGQAAWIRLPTPFEPTGVKGPVIGLATHEMPGPESTYNGLIGILAGLEMADRHYTMVQAYVLPPIPGATLDPTVEAIKRAVAAGKRVDIVTNSPQTIDTPQISGGIVRYAAHLLEAANKIRPDALHIFMKKPWSGAGGATLHAKVAYDDAWFVSDTSNNLHANGFLQHEGQRYYLDDELNAAVRSWGERLKDPAHSTEYTDPKRLLREQTPPRSATDPAIDALLALFPYQL